jgi:hypothetical protein
VTPAQDGGLGDFDVTFGPVTGPARRDVVKESEMVDEQEELGPKLTQLVDEVFGFSEEKAAAFIAESKEERAAGDADADPYVDAVGKFKHDFRTGKMKDVQPLLDGGLWDKFLKPFAEAMVEEARKAGA